MVPRQSPTQLETSVGRKRRILRRDVSSSQHRRIISLFGNCRNLSQDRSRACSLTSCGMLPELSSLAPFMMLFFLSGLVEHTWPFETRLDGKSENKRHMVTLVN